MDTTAPYATPGSYDDACDRAATQQGLDPLTAALTAAGIPHGVAQTGGFCMAVTIPVDTPAEPGAAPDAEPGMGGPLTGVWAVISGPNHSGSPEGTWGTAFYPGESWMNGAADADEEDAIMQTDRTLTTDALVALIRAGGRP